MQYGERIVAMVRIEAWGKIDLQLKRRSRQLEGRVSLAEKYQEDGFSHYPSKAEQLAERLLRKKDPQLAKGLDQGRAREAERQKAQRELERKRERQVERGPRIERGGR